MKEVRYIIKTPGISSKEIFYHIGKISSNQISVIPIDFDGRSFWVKTSEEPMGLLKKLERHFSIQLEWDR